ncbi:MAG: hypothetical protein Q4G58_07770 [bacterium]|nr:hypothetical protein [bacterium]
MKSKKWAISLLVLAQIGLLTGCLSNDHSLDALDNGTLASKPPVTVAPVTTAPAATASAKPSEIPASGEDVFAKYRTKLFGTWENRKSKDTYTFDALDGYSFAGKDSTQVGTYSFSTDSTKTMVILCLAGNQEIVNHYFKLSFDNDAQISVINGDGEKETWIRK